MSDSSLTARPVVQSSRVVDVLLPRRLHAPLSYVVDSNAVAPGDFVVVPLGRREEIGCVWDRPDAGNATFQLSRRPTTTPEIDPSRLKKIVRRLDAPTLPEGLRRFVDWVATYTLAPQGMVLAMAMRGWVATPIKAPPQWCRATEREPPKLSSARKKVMDAAGASPMSTKALAEKAGVSAAVVLACARSGLLRQVDGGSKALGYVDQPRPSPSELSALQDAAAGVLQRSVTEGTFAPILLEGVTGSGKTEVYFEAVETCLTQGQQTLVLLPEIALSSQWIERFEKRFGFRPLVWHSAMGDAYRRRVWHAVRQGGACVVVGARSALFLPFISLGAIIVDEEHEPAYKQEEGVIYNGRDMAIVRAQQARVPVILVSATPSLETLANVQAGRFQHLNLPDRHADAQMPAVTLLDMRRDPPARGRFLAPALLAACEDAFKRGEQAMLFLNRRGYAPLTLCRQCGHRIECPRCTAWLVEHRARRRLVCHHCDYTTPASLHCPSCNAQDSLVPVGPGIERITDEAREVLSGARILVMSSDTLTSVEAAREAGEKIARREVDLVIGTQLVAKGWHFPHLTVVGVVDSDLGLNGGDLRAAERTVQLLHQVSGRAGRASKPGRVLLQTYVPDHPAMKALASQDFHRFMQEETVARQPGFWPPYGRLAALIISASTPESADALARSLAAHAPHGAGVVVLGPAPAPLAMLRGRYRRRLLLRVRKSIAVQPLLKTWLSAVKCRGDQRIVVDIDPISFF